MQKERIMENKRVLISGAGVAGFTLAYWLKRYGFTPTIIEKYPGMRKGGYKVDVRGAAIEVARQMGIYQSLIDANVNLKSSKFVTHDLKVFEFDNGMLSLCSEDDIEVNRFDLVQILAKAVGEIEIIYNDSITGFDESEKRVYFEKGDPREFDLVIGADGIYSKVRKLFFGEDSQFIKEYGVRFCIFSIPNIFELDRSEMVYFDDGKFVATYAVKDHSIACLAFKSNKEKLPKDNLKEVFAEQFNQENWEIPRLIGMMKDSKECYFDMLAQVQMPGWCKGRVALVGDAGYAASAIGTNLALIGAYVLARELKRSNGDHLSAFANYETLLRKCVESSQKASTDVHGLWQSSDWKIKFQLWLMKILPGAFLKFFMKQGSAKIQDAAHSIVLDT